MVKECEALWASNRHRRLLVLITNKLIPNTGLAARSRRLGCQVRDIVHVCINTRLQRNNARPNYPNDYIHIRASERAHTHQSLPDS